jgi:hypothetical protein
LDVTDLEADEIFDKCSPAVFSVELYNENNEETGSASGFFISSSGIAVTNYHVIFGASSAKITTSDGKKYEVSGVYDYSKENVYRTNSDKRQQFPIPYNSRFHSPVNRFEGICHRQPAWTEQHHFAGHHFQLLAYDQRAELHTNHGGHIGRSSGGALLNTAGQVIGVTAATVTEGQNLNLAVPIHLIDSLETTSCVPISTLLPDIIKTYEYTFPNRITARFYTCRFMTTILKSLMQAPWITTITKSAIFLSVTASILTK